MDLSQRGYQKGHPQASTILLNNYSFWRSWEVRGRGWAQQSLVVELVPILQILLPTYPSPQDIESSPPASLSGFPWPVCAIPVLVVTQHTFQLFSALPSAFLFLRRWRGSCPGWALQWQRWYLAGAGKRAGGEGRVPGAEATQGSSIVLMSLNIVHLIPAWGSKRGSAHGSGWKTKICETWESLSYLQPMWGMHLGMWGWKKQCQADVPLWERNVN